MSNFEASFCTGEPHVELKEIVSQYQHITHNSVSLRFIDWGDAWAEFRKMTLARNGSTVSETGTTWMSSLSGRNDLRRFTPEEVRTIGGAGISPKSIWESCIDAGSGAVVGIPWIVDTYLVFYRQDILDQAGVSEGEAFSSLDNFHQTLEKIKKLGGISPLALPTSDSLSTMHNAASWIWGHGGDFAARDGKSLKLDTPQARDGIRQYFSLFEYMDSSVRGLTDEDCEAAFLQGKTAVILRNPSLLHALKIGRLQTEFRDRIRTAVQPGVPLIGGSNLVIWAYTPPTLIRPAVSFIKYLTDTEAQVAYFEAGGMLPARVEALKRISADPDYAPALQSFIAGRDMPFMPLWGLIEDKLASAFSGIWHAILETNGANINQTIEDVLVPVETRLNNILSQ